MNTKHTPGPWCYKSTNPPVICSQDGLDTIALVDSMGEMTLAQEAANARLIAAAPEMLEALKNAEQYQVFAVKNVGGQMMQTAAQYDLDKTRSAIAKGEGQ